MKALRPKGVPYGKLRKHNVILQQPIPHSFLASPTNCLFVTIAAISLSFYSNFSHFAYTTKFGLAPYLLRTCSVLALYLLRTYAA